MMLTAIMQLLKRLRRLWPVGSWNRQSSADGRSEEDRKADQFATYMHAIWIGCVPFALWMAFGEPPSWLAGSVIAILWVFAGFQFLTIGLVLVIAILATIWLAFPINRKKAEQWKDPQEEWEEGYDDLVKGLRQMKTEGHLSEDYEIPPKGRKEFFEYMRRTNPDRPWLRVTYWLAGGALVAALVVGGHPLLATVFAIPPLGWFALEGLEWAVIRWRGA